MEFCVLHVEASQWNCAWCNSMTTLHDKVKEHYQQLNNDHGYVLPRHQYLFSHRTLDQHLQHSYDNIQCWLCSVEARLMLSYHVQHLHETSKTFFPRADISSTTSGSTYNPSWTDSSIPASFTQTISTDSLTMSSTSEFASDYSRSLSITSSWLSSPTGWCLTV